jgi:hypothetical protein
VRKIVTAQQREQALLEPERHHQEAEDVELELDLQ